MEIKKLPAGEARNAGFTTSKNFRNPDVNHILGKHDPECRGDEADRWLKENDPNKKSKSKSDLKNTSGTSSMLIASTQTVGDSLIMGTAMPDFQSVTEGATRVETNASVPRDHKAEIFEKSTKKNIRAAAYMSSGKARLEIRMDEDVRRELLRLNKIQFMDNIAIYINSLPRVIRFGPATDSHKPNKKHAMVVAHSKYDSDKSVFRCGVTNAPKFGFLNNPAKSSTLEYRFLHAQNGEWHIEAIIPDSFWSVVSLGSSSRTSKEEPEEDNFDDDTNESINAAVENTMSNINLAVAELRTVNTETTTTEKSVESSIQDAPVVVSIPVLGTVGSKDDGLVGGITSTAVEMPIVHSNVKIGSLSKTYDMKLDELKEAIKLVNETMEDAEMSEHVKLILENNRLTADAPVVTRKRLL